MAKVHAYIIGHLREQMPWGLIGKKSKQQKLIENLPFEFNAVMKKHDLVFGDFPDVRYVLR